MPNSSARLLKIYFKRQVARNFRYDLPASIVVFLVALPLCLGIALASDAPLFSGIITGVVAGLVVGILSGSELSVSGPAAGLTVIVAAGIKDMGSFEAFLCAVALAGIFQMVLGFLRAGGLASLFPLSVIEGMLAAIGITIILKQIPYALGGSASFESDMTFLGWVHPESTLSQVLRSFLSMKVSAFAIAVASLVLLFSWENKRIKQHKILSKVPGPLLAVVMGVLANQIFHLGFENLSLHAVDGHLVQLPHIDSFSALIGELRFPDFSVLTNQKTWIVAITIACVGSIESLLSVESVDKLDPQRRVSNPSRELVAQGVGNTLAGLIGGIPMTAVIVRSSANVYAGARTRTSAFLHGVILLISVLALAPILNLIPLASLAAVLLAVGYKLAHPRLFKKMLHSGGTQFIPFLATIVAILATDLLKGVFIGLAVGLVFVIKASYYSAIYFIREEQDALLRFTKDVTFIHKVRLREVLASIEPGDRIFIDGVRAQFIDHDITEMVREFEHTAANRMINVTIRDVYGKHHPPSIRTERKDMLEKTHGVLQKAITRK